MPLKRLEENVLELPAVNDPQIAALLDVPNKNYKFAVVRNKMAKYHFAKTNDM